MQTKIKHMAVTYKGIKLGTGDAPKLRGFFAAMQSENVLLHQHSGNALLYRYPSIQYKVLSGHPTVVAVGEGISALYPLVMSAQTLVIGDREYPCGDFDIKLSEKHVGDSREMQRYRFLTPWFALNQHNYKIYEKAGEEERQGLLSAILKGNILSLAKGLNLVVEGRLETQLRLNEIKTKFKNETMLAFVGEFETNYYLPELLGIGKSVSRGYGTLGRIKHASNKEETIIDPGVN
jgi:hypothetical protein